MFHKHFLSVLANSADPDEIPRSSGYSRFAKVAIYGLQIYENKDAVKFLEVKEFMPGTKVNNEG